MRLIEIMLALAAIYSGAFWGIGVFLGLRNQAFYAADREAAIMLEANTFHLGLCCILALGFLGIFIR